MIENFGIGIDIVDVDRFREIPFERKKSFYENIFHKNEIDYCLSFKDPYPHFAGKFAIKEATIKSLNQKLTLKDIITDYFEEKPIIKLESKNFKKISFKLSISHEKNTAVAVVISESIG